MLSLDAEKLFREVRLAEEARDDHLKSYDDQLKRYYGGAYKSGGSLTTPENQYFQFVSLKINQVAFNNPRVRVQSRRTEMLYDIVSTACKFALNRWIKDEYLSETIRLAVLDSFFNYGVILVSRQSDGWPAASRISQKNWAMDSCARTYDDARFACHSYVMDKEDLLASAEQGGVGAGWDIGAIRSLDTDGSLQDFYGRNDQSLPQRGQVLLKDIWIRDDVLGSDPDAPEEFHGVVVTLSGTGGKRILRHPRPFYGPECGPYHLFGSYSVPDDAYPLGTLTANDTLIRELNATANALMTQAREFKRIIMVSSENAALPEIIKNAKDSLVIPVEGFNKDYVQSFEVGGLAPQLVEHLMMMKERVDLGLSLSDAKRGMVTGDATATENAIASAAGDSVTGFLRQRTYEHTQKLLESGFFHIFNDPDFEIELGEDFAMYLAQQGMDPTDTRFSGAQLRDEFGLKLRDLQFEIEPYSMERPDSPTLQNRALQLFQITTQVAPIIPQTPWIDWRTLFDVLGNAFNANEMKKIVDMNMASQFAQLMVGSQLAGPQTGTGHGASETKRPAVGYENNASYTGGINADVRVSSQGRQYGGAVSSNGAVPSGGQGHSGGSQGLSKGPRAA